MKRCKSCNTPQESRFYGKIWLSEDGYCSVCNVKYEDRPRTKSIFEFTIIPGENTHLDSQGRKLTESRILSYNNPNPSDYKKAKNKTIRLITEY